MRLMQRIKPKWFEGVDPFESLAWNDTVSAFEAELAKGGYLEGLLKKYLLNDNALTFTMTPSATYGDELVQKRLPASQERLPKLPKRQEVKRKPGPNWKRGNRSSKRAIEIQH